jgi:SAM-dependent methyltransferase
MTGLGEPIEPRGSAAVVASARELGLIESLAQPAPAQEHAARLGLDAKGTRLALAALAALGIAAERDGSFGTSDAVDVSIGEWPGDAGPIDGLWGHLPRFLRTGERFARMDGSTGERAIAYRELAGALGGEFEDMARELAAKLPPAGGRILDVGAGSGVWSLAMCERSPAARVTAVDLPEVLPAFRERAERLGLTGRTGAVAADYRSIELPDRGFDRVLLANVLHLESPDSARALVARVAPALRRAGELVVIDGLAEGDEGRERARSIYALHLAMRTRSGRLHSRSAIESWCWAAGLSEGELVFCDASPRALAALVHRSRAESGRARSWGTSSMTGTSTRSGSCCKREKGRSEAERKYRWRG